MGGLESYVGSLYEQAQLSPAEPASSLAVARGLGWSVAFTRAPMPRGWAQHGHRRLLVRRGTVATEHLAGAEALAALYHLGEYAERALMLAILMPGPAVTCALADHGWSTGRLAEAFLVTPDLVSERLHALGSAPPVSSTWRVGPVDNVRALYA